MADENNSYASKDPEQLAQDKGRKRRQILLVVVGLLVLLNGFLGYMYFNKKQEAKETQDALISTENLKKDLEQELTEVKDKNSKLKGTNERLDSLIAKRNSKIEQQAAKIKKLAREKQISVQRYQKAREQLERLRYYKKKYQTKIDSLIRVNKQLREENYNLRTEVRETKQEKSKLKDENVELENKVAKGSRLKLKEARITGIKIKNSGDKKETNNTNKIDQLKVCFNFQENPIADKGARQMIIRLINPKGETIYIQSRGGGQFTYKNDTTLYTFTQKVKYQNKDKEHCAYWSRKGEFPEGKYKMQLFTRKGYLVGEEKFELKSGFLGIF